MVGYILDGERGDRSAIKDLGEHDWNDSFTVPIVPPLPELKPGEIRLFKVDASGRNGADGWLGGRGANAEEAKGRMFDGNREWFDYIWSETPGRSESPAKKESTPKVVSPASLVRAFPGHMYVIHVMDGLSDFYVLVHVDGLVRGDNCTISWRRITGLAYSAGSAIPTSQAKPAGAASAETPEKPTLRAFGSSLNRLKWDPENQTAVETNDPNDKRTATEDVVRVETRLVMSSVLVLDEKGRAVQGLTQNDFVVTEDGQPQQISHFTLGDDASVRRSLVLIFDYSPSILPYIQTSVAAAKNLVDELAPTDRMAIVTDDVDLLVDFTRDKEQLKNALDTLATRVMSGTGGKSAQFSALLATLRELFGSEDVRPIVIFQTDGDQISLMQPFDAHLANPRAHERIVQFGLSDVNAAVEKTRVTIYTVIPGLRLIGLPPNEQARRSEFMTEQVNLAASQMRLKRFPNMQPPQALSLSPELSARFLTSRLRMQQAAAGVADISGGQTFFLEQPEQANDIYSHILSDVYLRYVIGYYPTNKTTDGKRRKVLIKVRNHPEYTVEGRKSYIVAKVP